jgi:hypothetical protein
MPTSRRFLRPAFYGAGYEAQDVLVETADVDLIELEATPALRWKENILRRLVWNDATGTLVFANPGLRPVRLQREYDLFVAYCPTVRGLLHLNAIKDWKEHCRTSVCFIDEIWAAAARKSRFYLRALDKFDHVVTGLDGSTRAISEILGRHCHAVPPGVDALRFSPYPDPPERVIDVYSLGRRQEEVHQQILKLAAHENRFYVHETVVDGGESIVGNHQEHRRLVAGLAKRSRCFMVAAAKVNARDETNGQVEVPNRYYEGAAAGAALVGTRLDCDLFRRLFDWPDAVVEIRSDGSDAGRVISELLADSNHLNKISARNAEEALLRHDWVYRWQQILRLAGLPPTAGMVARMSRLRHLAGLARHDRGYACDAAS